MPTLLLSPAGIDDTTALWQAARQLNWSVERLHGWRIPEWLSGDDFVVYGEGWFVEMVATHFSLALLQAPLDWLVHLPENLLKRHVQYINFADAQQRMTPHFIKPAQGKPFNAQVYQRGAELKVEEHIPQDTPVLIAEPVDWEIELRCFVLEGEISTMSPYFRDGDLVIDEDGQWLAQDNELTEAKLFTEQVLAETKLPPATVLDVGKIRGRGWAVLEANPAWASGIYGCDPTQVLLTIQRACIPSAQLTAEDQQWVLSE